MAGLVSVIGFPILFGIRLIKRYRSPEKTGKSNGRTLTLSYKSALVIVLCLVVIIAIIFLIIPRPKEERGRGGTLTRIFHTPSLSGEISPIWAFIFA